MLQFEVPFSALANWFDADANLQIVSEMGFMRFTLLVTWLSCGLTALSGALMLDRKPVKDVKPLLERSLSIALGATVIVILTLIVGAFVDSHVTVAIVMAVIYMLTITSTSGSMLASSMIEGPIVIFMIAMCIQLSAVFGFALLVVLAVVDYIPYRFRTA